MSGMMGGLSPTPGTYRASILIGGVAVTATTRYGHTA
jgi:hypothetical protein